MYTREDVPRCTGRGMCEKGVRIQERTYRGVLGGVGGDVLEGPLHVLVLGELACERA